MVTVATSTIKIQAGVEATTMTSSCLRKCAASVVVEALLEMKAMIKEAMTIPMKATTIPMKVTKVITKVKMTL